MNTNNQTEKENKFEWPPLEGDPEIFNKYAYKIGLDENYSFVELLSLDYKDMGMSIDTPVKAVIVNYERTGDRFYIKENIKNWNYVPFYMAQQGSLDNACGLVAILQSIGNIRDMIPYKSNSILSQFYESTKDLDNVKRCQFLENFKEIKEEHNVYSDEGQSNLCENQEQVSNHFVSFIYYNGNLIELDGCLEGPHVVKENIKEEDLVDETCSEFRRRLELGKITEKLSIMYLTNMYSFIY